MERKKYLAPEVEQVELRLERTIAASGDGSWDNSITNGTNWGSDDNDYGLE